MNTRPSTQPTLAEQAHQLLVAMTDKILRQYNLHDISDLALARATSQQQTKSVVVVGEVKRGKSALVNAIVGKRGLSPVGVTLTTTMPVAFAPETEQLTQGQACLFHADGQRIIAAAELEEWVSADRAGRWRNSSPLPTRATVAVRGMPLGDVALIDTPGIGGLDPKLSDLAKMSTDQACVLVVVCDCSTPITKPEMDFIKDTGANIEAIIVAVTKTDKNVLRWPDIIEENKRLLRHHSGRDIPVVGVSSLLAVLDSENPDSEQAQRARDLSGIDQLIALIAEKFRTAEYLPLANGLRTATHGLRNLATELEQRLATLKDSDTANNELAKQLEHLQHLKKQGETWDYTLGRDLTLIRHDAMDHLDQRLDQIRHTWTERINKQGMAVLRKNPEFFTAEMEREFQTAIAETITYFSTELEHKIVQPRFPSETTWEEIRNEVNSAFLGKQLQTHAVQDKRQGLLDPMMLMMGASGATMIGGAIGGIITFTGLGALVGVSWVAFNLGFRAMRSGKTNLIAWLRETSATAKMLTSKILESAIAGARPAIQLRHREQLKQHIETTQQRIKEAEHATKTDKATREKRITTLEKNLAIIGKNIEAAEAMIAKLNAGAGHGGVDKH